MLKRRAASERGRGQHGWLDAKHSFSFANYYDPHHMGFRALHVLNEDVIAPAHGFGEHGHQDMEIITWILGGELEHRDSLGNGGILRPGDAQVMSAGTGIRHSEQNPSRTQAGHLLQIWIDTRRPGVKPAYDQRHFSEDELRGRLCPLASGDGRERSLTIQQDAVVSVAKLAPNGQLDHRLAAGRHAWIQVAKGALTVNALSLQTGDGLAISDETQLRFLAQTDSEFLLIELP